MNHCKSNPTGMWVWDDWEDDYIWVDFDMWDGEDEIVAGIRKD